MIEVLGLYEISLSILFKLCNKLGVLQFDDSTEQQQGTTHDKTQTYTKCLKQNMVFAYIDALCIMKRCNTSM